MQFSVSFMVQRELMKIKSEYNQHVKDANVKSNILITQKKSIENKFFG
jgi:hypothetical protein